MKRHPRGLSTLFFTEAWERFSYYGMRSLLVLYMTSSVDDGGLGFDVPSATTIYGIYTSSVYVTSPLGGWIADRWLGARRAVFAGGALIACGQFALTLPAAIAFYAGMLAIALGTGLLKPNVSALVGSLYAANDSRRDAGFSIFYMGINLGATIAPLACGALAQQLHSWKLGFAAAGVGMLFGLAQFAWSSRSIVLAQRAAAEAEPTHESDPRSRLGVVAILCACCVVFFAAFEQSGSSLTLFADRATHHEIGGWTYPSSWFQSVNAVFILLLAPLFSWLWAFLGDRAPRSPLKFAIGLAFVGAGYLWLLPGASSAEHGLVSPVWLVGLYFLHTLGELCLSPIGLSTISKLAPRRLAGLMLGSWMVAIAFGNFLAGRIAGWYDPTRPETGVRLFATLAAVGLCAAAIVTFFSRKISASMGDVR